MVRITHYNTWGKHNTQKELQMLAEDIFQHGTITEVVHHGYTTNRHTGAGGETEYINDGGLCYKVDGLKGSKTRYWIHLRGCRVTEITEEYTY